MTENLKSFIEKISSDSPLQAELENSLTDLPNEEQISHMIAFAREIGFDLSQEDFTQETEDLDLSELDVVTGAGGCGCAMAGGGGGDDLKCGCVAVGHGRVRVKKKVFSVSQGACFCGGAGAGATSRH